MEPWDAERQDEATGTLIAALFAANGVPPRPPAEYMRRLRTEPKPQSQSAMKAVFGQVCEMVTKCKMKNDK